MSYVHIPEYILILHQHAFHRHVCIDHELKDYL